jgi:hypothetical protein
MSPRDNLFSKTKLSCRGQILFPAHCVRQCYTPAGVAGWADPSTVVPCDFQLVFWFLSFFRRIFLVSFLQISEFLFWSNFKFLKKLKFVQKITNSKNRTTQDFHVASPYVTLFNLREKIKLGIRRFWLWRGYGVRVNGIKLGFSFQHPKSSWIEPR